MDSKNKHTNQDCKTSFRLSLNENVIMFDFSQLFRQNLLSSWIKFLATLLPRNLTQKTPLKSFNNIRTST